MPAAPRLPWTRTPRKAEKPAAEVSISGAFVDKSAYRYKYPAGRKARKVIEGWGLKVAGADESKMQAHIVACRKGERDADAQAR